MLDAFIIEELRRREEAEERKSERPRLELPLYDPSGYGHEPASKPARDDDDEAPKSDRGVIIIEY
jgi:hypothetical protein